MRKVQLVDLGTIDYKRAWDFQEHLFKSILEQKMLFRESPVVGKPSTANYLVFCEHPHVYTLGKSGSEENLLINEAALSQKRAAFYKINRGGDITYHGPGQIVGYPIFNLDLFFTDIHKYLRFLEEAVILTLKEFGIESGRVKGLTGVWLDTENSPRSRKICAMGVRCSRWITMHGFALNVNTDLSYFEWINPCGIKDRAVTSMQKELGKEIDMSQVRTILVQKLKSLFEFETESWGDDLKKQMLLEI